MFNRTKNSLSLFILFMTFAAALPLNLFTAIAQEQTSIPPIHISDQVILPGEHFSDIVLADALQEEYPADQLTWTISGHTALAAQITDGVLSITPLDPAWFGSETLYIEACDPAGACSATDAIFWVMEDAHVEVTVTFVGNSGFMITAGDKKILIDALFAGLGDGYSLPPEEVDLLVNALPPFDGIDLILASHDHGDHFSAEMVCQHIKNDPDAVFVSTPAAANAVAAAGCPAVIPLDLAKGESTQLIANDIGVQAMFLSHGDPVYQNLGYVVTTGGRRFFHTGDIDVNLIKVAELQAFGVPEKNLDIAFLVHFALIQPGLRTWVSDGVNARYIFPIHYAFTTPAFNPARIRNFHPDAVIFDQEMESWTLPD